MPADTTGLAVVRAISPRSARNNPLSHLFLINFSNSESRSLNSLVDVGGGWRDSSGLARELALRLPVERICWGGCGMVRDLELEVTQGRRQALTSTSSRCQRLENALVSLRRPVNAKTISHLLHRHALSLTPARHSLISKTPGLFLPPSYSHSRQMRPHLPVHTGTLHT